MATTTATTLPLSLLPSTRHGHHPRRALTVIRCGPRDNRGPLVKGRILSIEAIHAIQTLKLKPNATNSLSRLLKSDLVAVLNELLRQNHPNLALSVFSVLKSDPSYSPDLSTHASLIRALSTNPHMAELIDDLISDLERLADEYGSVLKWSDERGLVKMFRALIDAERKEAFVRVYAMMKRCGWGKEGSGVVVDEYVAKVLARGFRKFGEVELAEEAEVAYKDFLSRDDCLRMKRG